MNKETKKINYKFIISNGIFSLLVLTLLLNVNFVLAEETNTDEEIMISNTNSESAPTPTQNNLRGFAPTTTNKNEQKKTLRERYQEKLEAFTTSKKENAQEVIGGFNENVQQRNQEAKQIMEEKKQEIMGRLDAQKKDRVKRQTDKIVLNFENALKKIEEISQKVQARIETMEERGVDLTEAKNLISETFIKIEEARISISEMKNAFLSALDSETPRETFAQTKEVAKISKEKIKEAHQSLIKVINAIKASVKAITTTSTNQ